MSDKTTIQVSNATKERLDKIGGKGDTYDTIIIRLLNGRVRRPIGEVPVIVKKKTQGFFGRTLQTIERAFR